MFKAIKSKRNYFAKFLLHFSPTWCSLDTLREFFRKVEIFRCMHKMLRQSGRLLTTRTNPGEQSGHLLITRTNPGGQENEQVKDNWLYFPKTGGKRCKECVGGKKGVVRCRERNRGRREGGREEDRREGKRYL